MYTIIKQLTFPFRLHFFQSVVLHKETFLKGEIVYWISNFMMYEEINWLFSFYYDVNGTLILERYFCCFHFERELKV